MGIIIDKREKERFRKMLRTKGLEFDEGILKTGDVICWNDEKPKVKVVIERKKIDDLISSFYNKRLKEQFTRLSDEDFSVLIITGSLEKTNMVFLPFHLIPKFVEEVMSMAIVNYNFRSVIWLLDGNRDVHNKGFYTMVKCLEKVIAGQLDVIPQRNIKRAKIPAVTALMNMFSLNEKDAKNILLKFNSVREIIDLKYDDFLSVAGIGVGKAKSITNILHKNYGSV